jgi:succinate dehydrogenase/fumarate reductase flavoprotein subunit
MGLIDGIVSWISSFIGSTLGGAIRGCGDIAAGFIKQKIKAPEPWETINVEEEEKKVDFKRTSTGGYLVYYDTKELGEISVYDLKSFPTKSEESAKLFLIYKLEVMHRNFKNRNLSRRLAEKLYQIIKADFEKK